MVELCFLSCSSLNLITPVIYRRADRYSMNKSWDHIQNKFVGTGHSDMSKFEWISNQHRDTIASHIGHSDMLSFFALAQNDSIGRVRYQLLEVIIVFYMIECMSDDIFIPFFPGRKCYSPAGPHRRDKMMMLMLLNCLLK
jgi:splicing factor 3B subunit 5